MKSELTRPVPRHPAHASYRLPLTLKGAQTVLDGRRQVEAIIKGDDDRLLVIVG